MIKTKLLFSLFATIMLAVTGCNQQSEEYEEDDDEIVERFIKVKGNESIEITSPTSYSLKSFYFQEVTPIFVDSHIDHFVIPLCGQRVITNVHENGFYILNVNLKAKATGGLYFNINYQINEGLQDAFRIELYTQSINKSTIYSFDGRESITEGKIDLDCDNQYDKDPITREEIIYTTGEHSYQTEAFNTSPYLNVNENDEISIKATIYFDGFYLTNGDTDNQNPSDLEMLFDIR